jgi:hypothetical protein
VTCRVRCASEQLSVVLPTSARAARARAVALSSWPTWRAAADLNRYLEFEPAARDAEDIRKQLALIEQLHERRN